MIKDAIGPLKGAAWASLGLAILKGVAFWLTGSLLVLAAFLDSLGDSVISLVNSKIHEASLSRPDRKHPYGHGGYEVLGAIFQGSVLCGAAAVLCFESIERLFRPGASQLLESRLTLASLMLGVGSLGGFLIYLYLKHCHAKLSEQGLRSTSLLSDAAHYRSDAWSNLSALIGVLSVYYFGLPVLDALCGLLGAGFMGRSAWPILKRVVNDILHSEVDKETQRQIKEIALKSDERIQGLHRLRTRELGPVLFADFHLKLPATICLEEAHNIETIVIKSLRNTFPKIDCFVHLDPDTEEDEEGF